ncbi:GNAT family N-acetyltransferase [Rhodospira trueperi]|uniref:Acetyltransferase (GNAT) family protein n=1 Tax=Rhodospira trueperi TaxID=69960 RepID=A0A1G7GQF7_9PROT|nr:GNAT family N-acetyltransferase [Rhodospira trueperi]SDE90219.1 Acetyltransferase (GNAT) family protein [Rhodospira trueperi]
MTSAERNAGGIPRDFSRGGATLVLDSFLSDIMGKPAYDLKLAPTEATATAADAPLEALLANFGVDGTPALVSCRLRADDVNGIQALEESGFRMIECYLDFEINMKATASDEPDGPTHGLRLAGAADRSALKAIASSGFTSSRLHLDPAIPKAQADESRRRWLANSLDGRAEAVYCTVDPERGPSGFVACRRLDGAEPGGRLDLIAVAPHARGYGHGRALIGAFVRHCRRADYRYGRVGTQAHNLPAIRLYESLGFRLDAAFMTLHLHRSERRR